MNVFARASQTFHRMQELRAKGHLTGHSERYKVTSREYRIFIVNNICLTRMKYLEWEK